jgi:hypothetical protein
MIAFSGEQGFLKGRCLPQKALKWLADAGVDDGAAVFSGACSDHDFQIRRRRAAGECGSFRDVPEGASLFRAGSPPPDVRIIKAGVFLSQKDLRMGFG